MGALSKFLRSHPGEDNFLMDLTDQGQLMATQEFVAVVGLTLC